MKAMLLTKSNNWKYEQEWRLIKHKNGPGLYSFPKERLSGIIWGAEMPEHCKEVISGIISSNKYNLSFFQSIYVDREYKIKIVKV